MVKGALVFFVILVNVSYVIVVIRFERKKRADDFKRKLNWKMRELKWTLFFDNIRWKRYMDKKFEHMTKAAEKYLAAWKEEQIIFDEICKGTRPFSDMDKLQIIRKYDKK